MAKLPGAFNANEHEDISDFEPLPVGEYQGKIIESELKRNSSDTGNFLKLVFQITDGKYSGRRLFSNLNLIHPNEKAVEIAQKEMAAICRACGKITVSDSEELHGIDMMLKVAIRPATAKFPASNEIKNYKQLDGAAIPSKDESKPKKVAKVSFD